MGGLEFFLIPVVLFGALMIWGHQRRKKRQAGLVAWAEARNWHYAKTDKTLLQRWNSTPFTSGRGNKPSASDVMWGPITSPNGQARQALSFNFTYTVSSGSGDDESETTYRHHVTCVFFDLRTPVLEVTRENFGSKFSKLFGGQDIQFEAEDFNKAWRIQATNLKFAHDVIHPRMMEYLMTMTGRGFNFVLPGDCVMVFNKVALDLSAVDPMIAVCNQIMDQIPAHVYEDFL